MNTAHLSSGSLNSKRHRSLGMGMESVHQTGKEQSQVQNGTDMMGLFSYKLRMYLCLYVHGKRYGRMYTKMVTEFVSGS